MKIHKPTPAELKLIAADRRKDTVTGWSITLAALLTLWGLAILGWQCLQWLKFGDWPVKTWAHGLRWLGSDYPTVNGIGAQRIVDWVMGLPMWTLPIAIGLGGATLWVQLSDKQDPKTREAISNARSYEQWYKAYGSPDRDEP